MAGRPQPGQEHQQPNRQGQQQGEDTTHDASTQPQHRQDDQIPGVHVYRGGGPGFAWTASTRVIHPRDANNPQPQGQTFDDLPRFLNQMFPTPAGAQQGADAFGMGPLGGIFANLLNPANMQHGDAVYSQEALDRIISQLMEQNTAGNAPGPATAEAIANLPMRNITESDLDDQGKADCSICMEDVAVGEKVIVLPCSHWFHGDCIRAWLGEHDTCPHCRKGIMPQDGSANLPRNANQPPRHDTNWGQSEGTRENPHPASERPSRHRRSSSSSNRTPGLFGRMRDAFGSGGGGGSGGGASSSSARPPGSFPEGG